MPTENIRLNKFIAQITEMSRRSADTAITEGRVLVNGRPAATGQSVTKADVVSIDGKEIKNRTPLKTITILLNKPVGYVCSRKGQGNRTIYELLPPNLQRLNSVGRLDKDSSGLLLLTNDGNLANNLTHPRYQKIKVYEVSLDKPLQPLHQQMVCDYGITLEDGISKLQIEKQDDSAQNLLITMHEGRNRQIRRTFESLGYSITRLHRTVLGNYYLSNLELGQFRPITEESRT